MSYTAQVGAAVMLWTLLAEGVPGSITVSDFPQSLQRIPSILPMYITHSRLLQIPPAGSRSLRQSHRTRRSVASAV
jgi:hypothetical protein